MPMHQLLKYGNSALQEFEKTVVLDESHDCISLGTDRIRWGNDEIRNFSISKLKDNIEQKLIGVQSSTTITFSRITYFSDRVCSISECI